jgi:uncharacterized protein
MPSIRELVTTLAAREEVEAAVVLGRDGLVIDSSAAPGIDTEGLAALVPSVLAAADEFGVQRGTGELRTTILEYTDRLAVISALSSEAALLVLAHPTANIGALMFELRRNREHIAALV